MKTFYWGSATNLMEEPFIINCNTKKICLRIYTIPLLLAEELQG